MCTADAEIKVLIAENLELSNCKYRVGPIQNIVLHFLPAAGKFCLIIMSAISVQSTSIFPNPSLR